MDNTILLVEDEEKTGEMLKKALETEGMAVDLVLDGKTAIHNMEKGKYDLIILDLKLPEISGADVLENIREIDPYVEVVVYTNYPTDSFDPSVIKKLFKYSVEEYVNKGADADLWEMVEKIKAILDPFSEKERNMLRGRFDQIPGLKVGSPDALSNRPLNFPELGEQERLLFLRSPNMRGNDVVEVQQALAKKGYDIKPDGHFGPHTRVMVIRFQERNGLTPDGVVESPVKRTAIHGEAVSFLCRHTRCRSSWLAMRGITCLSAHGKP